LGTQPLVLVTDIAPPIISLVSVALQAAVTTHGDANDGAGPAGADAASSPASSSTSSVASAADHV
jgi:hypothetical protein